jgi:hypothetical protein
MNVDQKAKVEVARNLSSTTAKPTGGATTLATRWRKNGKESWQNGYRTGLENRRRGQTSTESSNLSPSSLLASPFLSPVGFSLMLTVLFFGARSACKTLCL